MPPSVVMVSATGHRARGLPMLGLHSHAPAMQRWVHQSTGWWCPAQGAASVHFGCFSPTSPFYPLRIRLVSLGCCLPLGRRRWIDGDEVAAVAVMSTA